MPDLQYRQKKIQDKRKQTPWREFVRDIASWGSFVFYKNSGLVSKFPETERVKVVDVKAFEETRDNPKTKDIDNQNSFFLQYKELRDSIYLPAFMHRGLNENSEYTDIALGSKDCYLSTGVVTDVSNVLYSWSVKDYSHNIQNSSMVRDHCDNVYSSLSIVRSSDVFYSRFITDSNAIWFSSNLLGCHECIFCDNLQNQSYCIYNKQYDKTTYTQEKEKILRQKDAFNEHYATVSSQSINMLSDNSSGNSIVESSDVENGYYIYKVQNGRNLFLGGAGEDNSNMYDVISFGSPLANDVYGGYSVNQDHVYCSAHSAGSSHVFYSYFLENCSFCLGCIGLKNKQFCIFNKQYTKDERYVKVNEIFAAMEQEGTLGEFFPASMNPFYFNDTAAYLIDPSFTKEEATKLGYLWRDEAVKVDIPVGAEVVKTSELGKFEGFVIAREHSDRGNPGGIQWIASSSLHSSSQGQELKWHIDPGILKKTIIDEQGNYYRIVQKEYDFLLKKCLPLPRTHWLTRMRDCFMIQK